MFASLRDINPQVELSKIGQPFVISVDADIPPGACVLLQLDGINRDGQPWQKIYLNPRQAALPTPVFTNLGLGIRPAPDSLALPLVYAVTIEGYGQKRIYTAEVLYQAIDPTRIDAARLVGASNAHPIELMLPKEELSVLNKETDNKPFLTYPLLPRAHVSLCKTTRPYILEMDGDAPLDSQMIFTMSGRGKNGNSWEQSFHAPHYNHIIKPSRTPIKETNFQELQFGITLNASSDGYRAPGLVSIAIEGDGRRFFLRAADLFGDASLPESLELIQACNSDFSCLTLKAHEPEFFGFPSVLDRLNDMFQQGQLRPDWAPALNSAVNFSKDEFNEISEGLTNLQGEVNE